MNSEVAKLAGLIAYRRRDLDVARQRFEEARRLNPTDCEVAYDLGIVHAEQRNWESTARVFVSAAACLEHAQRELAEAIVKIQASNSAPDRKAGQIARREQEIVVSRRRLATSWFNTAAANFNLARKPEARQYAEKVAADVEFGERARDLIAQLK